MLASVTGWLITHLAERASGRWRLTILQFRPIARLLIAVGVVLLIIPILVQPTFQNVVALIAALSLALAFALKDYGSSLVAGLVTVLEGTYQPGDWIQVDDTYGEVRSIGMRAVRIVTPDDTEVVIPHTKIWNSSVFNATSGSHRLLCVADFYLNPHHDAALVRQRAGRRGAHQLLPPAGQPGHRDCPREALGHALSGEGVRARQPRPVPVHQRPDRAREGDAHEPGSESRPCRRRGH